MAMTVKTTWFTVDHMVSEPCGWPSERSRSIEDPMASSRNYDVTKKWS